MRTHLECRATPTTRTTQRTSRALNTAMVIGHLNCSIFSPIPMAPARLMPLKGFRISKLRFTAMLVFCFMPFSATNSRPNIVLLLTGASNSSPRAVSCGCIFFFKVASIVSVCKKHMVSIDISGIAISSYAYFTVDCITSYSKWYCFNSTRRINVQCDFIYLKKK